MWMLRSSSVLPGWTVRRAKSSGLEVSVKAAQAAAPYADGLLPDEPPFNRIALMERLIARLKDEGIAD